MPVNKCYLNIILILFTVITSCKKNKHDFEGYYSKEVFNKVDSIAEHSGRQAALVYIDSLYKKVSPAGTRDKFDYYFYKSRIYNIRHIEEKITDSGYLYIDSAVTLLETTGAKNFLRKEYAEALTLKTEFCMFLRNYNEAFTSIAESKFVNLEVGDSCLAGDNSALQGLISFQQKKFEQAIPYFKEALVLFEHCSDETQKFYQTQGHLDNLGLSFSRLGKTDSAMKYYLKAEDYILNNRLMYKQQPLFPYEALVVVYSNIAIEYQLHNDLLNAEKYLQKAEDLFRYNLKDTAGDIEISSQLAGLYNRTGNLTLALKYAGKVNAAIDKFNIEGKKNWYKTMSSIAASLNNVTDQLKYLKLFTQATDSINNLNKGLFESNPENLFEQLEKKHQFEILQKNNEIQRTYISLIAIGFLLLSLLAYSIFRNYSKSKKLLTEMKLLNKELEIRKDKLKLLMAEREEQQKKEKEDELLLLAMKLDREHNNEIQEQRRKISEDMHDELCSSLAALNFYIRDIKEKIKKEKSMADHLDNILAESEVIYQNARQYMHGLKTGYWNSGNNIPEYLKELKSKLTERNLMQIELEVDNEKIQTLAYFQQSQLYYIIKEAVTNILKHAAAKQIIINIWFQNNNCFFKIKDSGKGFDAGQITSGIGIESIKSRITQLEGEVGYSSGTSGTTLEGHFPLLS